MKLDNVIKMKDSDDHVKGLIELIENTERYLRIRSAILDPVIFNDADVLDALSQFARSSRYVEIHILVDHPEYLLRTDHKLLALSRRLSQKISIKEFIGDKDDKRPSCVLSDQRGVFIKYQEDDAEGLLSLTDSVMTKRLNETFIYDWQRAGPARQLRTLSL